MVKIGAWDIYVRYSFAVFRVNRNFFRFLNYAHIGKLYCFDTAPCGIIHRTKIPLGKVPYILLFIRIALTPRGNRLRNLNQWLGISTHYGDVCAVSTYTDFFNRGVEWQYFGGGFSAPGVLNFRGPRECYVPPS